MMPPLRLRLPSPRRWSVATKLAVLIIPPLLLFVLLVAWFLPDQRWLLWITAGICVVTASLVVLGTRLVVTQPVRELTGQIERITQGKGELNETMGIPGWADAAMGREIRTLWERFLRMHQTLWSNQQDRADELQREVQAHESLNQRLYALYQLTQSIQQAVSEEDVYRTLSHSLHQALPLREVLILRLSASEDRLEIVSTSPKRDDLGPESYPVWDEPARCPVIRSGREYRVQDTHRDLTCPKSLSNGQGGGYWCVPLIIGGHTIGVVHLASSIPECWTDESRWWIEALINAAAPMIGHLQHLQRAKRRALIDELTGAYNRRFLEEFLAKTIFPDDRRKGQFLSLLMIDLDHFKRVNDTYGHQVGDEVLKTVASILHRTLKESDILARYGGEEFTVVLPRTETGIAAVVAERLRAAIAGLSFRKLAPAAPDQVTISVGVATYPDHARSVRDLIRAADGALYQAKSLGRNRVVCAGLSTVAVSGRHDPLRDKREPA